MHCKDGRALELSAVVTVAPGFLSSYTKIVRFLPRYVVVNTLPYPVRIWQDSSVFRPLSADHVASNDRISKWRYTKEGGRRSQSKVNQYEALWGRETRLDERGAGSMLDGTAAHGSALYINTIFPSEIMPFCLPDSHGERQLRVDLGSPWNLTASVSAVIPGDHTLRVDRAVDLRVLPHVSTRSNPRYEVKLPPSGGGTFDGELGIWFETEWGTSRSLIVKAVKKKSYAFNETDVHVGDELLMLDDIPVARMTFAEAMSMLRSRLSEQSRRVQSETPRRPVSIPSRRFVARTRSDAEFSADDSPFGTHPLTLTFRTVEERLRNVRLKAAKASGGRRRPRPEMMFDRSNLPAEASTNKSTMYIQAEVKALPTSHLGAFLVLRDEPIVPFEIQNQSITRTIYYRQRGCYQHAWQSLKPGQSNSYSWDEPLKSKRLTVRAAADSAFNFAEDDQGSPPSDLLHMSTDGDHRRRHRSHRNLKDEDVYSPSISVRLEEIGYSEYLPLQYTGLKKESLKTSKYLKLEVDVDGGTRVLEVNDVSGEESETQMTRHLESLKRKVDEEEKRLQEIRLLSVFLGGSSDILVSDEENLCAAEAAKTLMEDFSEDVSISSCHQIVVEVLEAIGLSPASFVGSCNPYCEVSLKSGSLGSKSLFRKKDVRKTNYVRKSVNPTWNAQSFVFEVPSEAVSVTRGHSIHVRVRNFRQFMSHHTLGRAQVDLHSVRDQEPLVGWFPLAGRTGRRELDNELSHWGRGSVKLRVQWIYSIPALVQYFVILSERRQFELRESLDGMAKQLAKKKDVEEKKKAGIDGFKAVRVKELLSLPRSSRKRRAAQIQRLRLTTNGVKQLIEPLRPRTDAAPQKPAGRPFPEADGRAFLDETIVAENRPCEETRSVSFLSTGGTRDLKKRANSLSDCVQTLEDRIYLQRQTFHKYMSSRARGDGQPTFQRDGVFPVTSFKFWAFAQAVFSDSDFEIELLGNEIKIRLRRAKPSLSVNALARSQCENITADKLSAPPSAPTLMRSSADAYIGEFLRSRESFERAARIAMKTVLHQGGWLTIRPMTALNLPASYTGMTVKLKYGSDVLFSGTVRS